MGYYTGMRLAEILHLDWSLVDLKNRIIHLTAEMTKEDYDKRVPIPKILRDMLLQIPDRGHEGHVFTYAGKPVKDIRQGLENACQKSDIIYGRFEQNGFVFHDLRHTFATNAHDV